MLKTLKYITVVNLLFITFNTSAQVTTSSPYSAYGLGDLKSSSFPQTKAMGGISMGIRKMGGAYNMINTANPASYSSIGLTTFDIGAGMVSRQLNQRGTLAEHDSNIGISHIAFAMPINKKSALSFGLLPYSEIGYQNKTSTIINNTSNSTAVDYIRAADGGLSKVYLGYGLAIIPNLSIGVNAAYLFGSLNQSTSTENPQETNTLNSREQVIRSIGAVNLDYGLQYTMEASRKSKVTIGYAGAIVTKFNVVNTKTTSSYRKDFSSGNETISLGSPFTFDDVSSIWTIPMTHTVGFAFEKTNKLLVGADASYCKWNDLREGTVNPGLNNSYSIAAGAQLTPDINAIGSYFKLVDYRFGLKYDKTYINIDTRDIDQYAVTFGLGLPLRSNRLAFYKVNFSTEIGTRGTLEDGLVRENYVKFSLGFTMNDKWFIKSKFD